MPILTMKTETQKYIEKMMKRKEEEMNRGIEGEREQERSVGNNVHHLERRCKSLIFLFYSFMKKSPINGHCFLFLIGLKS